MTEDDPLTIDALAGDWTIAQRTNGHRHSIDDVLTADHAIAQCPHATAALDLGAGIGGVGLLVLWRLGAAARLVCVEAQDVSFALLQGNIARNGLAARVHAIHGDLRTTAIGERFALVTGSPPYFPPGTGVMPADSQKAHARFELRGDVGDYARCAERHLADDGVFVFCFPTVQRDRALELVHAGGLVVTQMRDVIPRESLRPLFTLFAARRAGELVTEPPFVVRTRDGTLTDAMQAVRRRFGFS